MENYELDDTYIGSNYSTNTYLRTHAIRLIIAINIVLCETHSLGYQVAC